MTLELIYTNKTHNTPYVILIEDIYDNLASWLLNDDTDSPDPDLGEPFPEGDGINPEGDGPEEEDPAGGPNIGGDGPDEEDPDKKDKGSGKGKGKARAVTPENVPEEPVHPYTYDADKSFQDDLEKAKLNSLREKHGESSKEGGMLEQPKVIKEVTDYTLDEYRQAKKAYLENVRAYNDILDHLDNMKDTMDITLKEELLNESIKLKNAVEHYSDYSKMLKNELNLSESEPEYTSDENWSEYSSDQESRPSKRPKN